MNIKEAKEQIMNAMKAYFTKDKYGKYLIPVQKQRPVFLMGPPGIGKTAIMEQVAQEMGVGLLSYSMTHHTRQSALGLPFIEHKNYQGEEFDISEYTMSEIIASAYEMMEKTGLKEGILFLDEINCVSETLAPIMLQFLQYKVFGRHKVPDGWIVVTAGNPPEYNNSVREFDIVTWDRLKRVDVEPDFDVWKEYAYKTGVHPAVTTYLEIKKADFYKVESTVEGKTFVTARGWDDLSQMIKLYELNDIKVDEKLIRQYLQNSKIAKNFAVYYDLFNKYKSDYQVGSILAGNASEEILSRAKAAKFDERLSLLGLMLDAITSETKNVVNYEATMKQLLETLKVFKSKLKNNDPEAELEKIINGKERDISSKQTAGTLSADEYIVSMEELDILNEEYKQLSGISGGTQAFEIVKKDFDSRVKHLKKISNETTDHMNNVFRFSESAFAEGQEMLVLVTELTANYYGAKFISRYGCEEYFKHNKNLLFYERQKDIEAVLDELELRGALPSDSVS